MHYGNMAYFFTCLVRLGIFILLFILLNYLYKKTDNSKKEKKDASLLNTFILYLITLFFITIISIISDWQLMPLADLGDKYSIFDLWNKLGDVCILCCEIFIMISMYKHFDIFFTNNNVKQYKYFTLAIFAILLTFSIYSVITNFSIYQFDFIPFTLLLGFIYPYTERSFWKTYLITVLVFLF